MDPVLSAMFDWNRPDPGSLPSGALDPSAGATVPFGVGAAGVKLVDETLRDGLQSASGVNPPVDQKIDLLHAMARVGVDVVSVGLPAAGQRNAEDCYRLCREIVEAKLPMIPTAAARTVPADVQGIARAADRAGIPIEVYSFIGTSPIRQFAESWDAEFLTKAIVSSIREAVAAGLSFCLVTEDTTRSHPDMLRTLYRAAVDAGAKRLCLCDTTGHVTPYGVEELVGFVRRELDSMGATHVGLDWHGHNDRGLAVQTAIWAASVGVGRIHGTGLGIGERVGNASLELLVENLGRLGARRAVPRAHLAEYCALAARALCASIPPDHPIAGARMHGDSPDARAYRPEPGGGSGADAPDGVPRPGGATSTSPRDEGRSRPSDRLVPMTLRVGGEPVHLAVHPRRTLLEALRYDLDLVGTKQGCDKGDCGACTVLVEGRPVLACLTLALEADGRDVRTVESLAGAPHVDPILDCFDKHGGGQCGFCTPGMLMAATGLLEANPSPSRDEIKLAISGNLCRCTGYTKIVEAIEAAAAIRRGEAPGGVDLPGTAHVPPPLPSNDRREQKKRPGGSDG